MSRARTACLALALAVLGLAVSPAGAFATQVVTFKSAHHRKKH